MVDLGKRPLGRARAWLGVLAIFVLGLFAAPAAMAVPADFWGVSPQNPPTVEQFQRLKAGGVDSVRIPIAWSGVQPFSSAEANFSASDILVAGAAAAGINVLPFVYEAPSWAVPRVRVPGSSAKAPKTVPVKTGAQRTAWSNFLKLVVARYGPGGSFWAANPTLPAAPIRTWQIWNEENFKYFVARPNPADYGKLVNISYSAIKSVDPGAKLILGGMFARPGEAKFKVKPPQAYYASDFLDQLYSTTPGIKKKFSGVALHPYTTSYQQLTPDVEEFLSVLKANHDAGKKLWITEIGWSSEPKSPGDSFAKGPKGQVTQLNGAFKLFKAKAAKWKLQRIYWFSVDDQPGICNFCGGSGLFAKGFVPKKSWYAYVKFAGGTP
ncbi:MAG TPA: glycosyl hydrolase [Solirubrobacterales bacterium]|nr:glycosyl hydrolase [Solirubrobacterales bacterium]